MIQLCFPTIPFHCLGGWQPAFALDGSFARLVEGEGLI